MALPERVQGLTVASALARIATSDPESTYIHSHGVQLTFGEVDHQAEALAAALHGLGVEAGDRVALLLPSWSEFVVSMMAVAKLGGVVVPLDPRLTSGELQYMLRHSEAVAAVTVETWEGVDYLHRFEDLLVHLPELQYLVTVGEEDLWYDDRIFQYEDMISSGAGRDFAAPHDVGADEVFALVYTPGTTGKPKGVELSHANLIHAAWATARGLELTGADVVAGVPALHHVFGMGTGVLGCLLSGSALVLSEGASPGALLDLVEAHGVTVLCGLPTVFVTEMEEQERRPRDLSSLRLGLAAGAAVSSELVARVEAEFCPLLLVAYSMTEAAATLAMTRPGDPPERRRTTVGRPVADTEVRVVKDGGELPVESIGEIAVRGPGVMRGYYRQPQETERLTDAEGFFLTGDMGMVDEDGFVHLVGRDDEVILRAGFKIYPRSVEDRLLTHPAVDEAVVVGLRDPSLGEATCACVIPVEGAMLTPDEIRDWCGQTLSPDKVPDHVRFVDAFPRALTGRVRRGELIRSLGAEAATT